MTSTMQLALIGWWVSDSAECQSLDKFGATSLEFMPGGRLTYISHGPNRDQFTYLTYRIDGDVLITDQPSAPRENRTAFKVLDDGRLALHFDGVESIYRHLPNGRGV